MKHYLSSARLPFLGSARSGDGDRSNVRFLSPRSRVISLAAVMLLVCASVLVQAKPAEAGYTYIPCARGQGCTVLASYLPYGTTLTTFTSIGYITFPDGSTYTITYQQEFFSDCYNAQAGCYDIFNMPSRPDLEYLYAVSTAGTLTFISCTSYSPFGAAAAATPSAPGQVSGVSAGAVSPPRNQTDAAQRAGPIKEISRVRR